MLKISTIGLDLAKSVFQVHGADASGAVVLRKTLRRDRVLAFFGSLPPCVVAMEACAGANSVTVYELPPSRRRRLRDFNS